MTTNAFPPHPASRDAMREQLSSLRDARLKRAGLSVDDRTAFIERRIRMLRGEK